MRSETRGTPREARRQRRVTRRAAREARVTKVKEQLTKLRGRHEVKKRHFALRVVRFVLLFPVIIALGLLAIGLRAPDLLEWPLKLLYKETKGTIRASKDSDRAREALDTTRAEAAQLGLGGQGLTLADEPAADSGGQANNPPSS